MIDVLQCGGSGTSTIRQLERREEQKGRSSDGVDTMELVSREEYRTRRLICAESSRPYGSLITPKTRGDSFGSSSTHTQRILASGDVPAVRQNPKHCQGLATFGIVSGSESPFSLSLDIIKDHSLASPVLLLSSRVMGSAASARRDSNKVGAIHTAS